MKKYKKVELLAKNAPRGSYVAGCPVEKGGTGESPVFLFCRKGDDLCIECERTH